MSHLPKEEEFVVWGIIVLIVAAALGVFGGMAIAQLSNTSKTPMITLGQDKPL